MAYTACWHEEVQTSAGGAPHDGSGNPWCWMPILPNLVINSLPSSSLDPTVARSTGGAPLQGAAVPNAANLFQPSFPPRAGPPVAPPVTPRAPPTTRAISLGLNLSAELGMGLDTTHHQQNQAFQEAQWQANWWLCHSGNLKSKLGSPALELDPLTGRSMGTPTDTHGCSASVKKKTSL